MELIPEDTRKQVVSRVGLVQPGTQPHGYQEASHSRKQHFGAVDPVVQEVIHDTTSVTDKPTNGHAYWHAKLPMNNTNPPANANPTDGPLSCTHCIHQERKGHDWETLSLCARVEKFGAEESCEECRSCKTREDSAPMSDSDICDQTDGAGLREANSRTRDVGFTNLQTPQRNFVMML